MLYFASNSTRKELPMKKFIICSAVICLSATNVLAAGGPGAKPVSGPKSQTRINTGNGAKVGGQQVGAQSGAATRSNIGTSTTAKTGAGAITQGSDPVSLAAQNVLQKRLLDCGSDTPAATMTSSIKAELAEAQALGLTDDKCLTKFAAAGDAEVAQTASLIALDMRREFKTLGVADVNADGKINVADLTDRQKGQIIDSGAEVLANRANLSEEKSESNLEETVSNGCDIVSKDLGTKAAFQQARSL
jgi:hypothetical protein